MLDKFKEMWYKWSNAEGQFFNNSEVPKMPENRDYITSTDESGSISISEDVVSRIAALAIAEVDGVSTVAPIDSETDRKTLARALRITPSDGGGVSVDISVRVRYGEKIQTVAQALQNAVAQAIDSLAGLKVETVDVHVVGLDFSTQVTE